jgi:acylpyruvate hydrolase
MRLVSYLDHLRPRAGVLLEDKVIDLRQASLWYRENIDKNMALLPCDMKVFLAGGEKLKRCLALILEEFISGHEGFKTWKGLLEASNLQYAAPIPRPGKIICVGSNYPAFPPVLPKAQYPILFLKASSSVIGSGQAIRLPRVVEDAACEAELVIVIGNYARELNVENADSCVAGFSIANDLGDRKLESRTSQWTSGKLMDTFCPWGPAIVTIDEVADAQNLDIETRVNGTVIQMGNTRDMIFDIRTLISYISHLTTLEPGDVIWTGSPKRIGNEPAPKTTIIPGDVIEIKIGNLGTLINPVEGNYP